MIFIFQALIFGSKIHEHPNGKWFPRCHASKKSFHANKISPKTAQEPPRRLPKAAHEAVDMSMSSEHLGIAVRRFVSAAAARGWAVLEERVARLSSQAPRGTAARGGSRGRAAYQCRRIEHLRIQ